ncbi:MAG TPA: hypothetical protein VEK75_06590 [Xanthobacteraceae bacterium]|nr:hypothetical protein [Xanthobacteraceae bacterium]
MVKFVAICVGIIVLAAGFIVVSQTQDIAALFDAFSSEPLTQKLAWFVIALAWLALVPTVLWLVEALIRQRKANDALEQQLGGARQGVRGLARAQVDADAAVHHLARTDPDAAIGAITQRLAEAERIAQVQAGRNEIGDLQSRVDELRARQERLQERLAPVLEQRGAIERLFVDLDSRESNIERVLGEITGADDAAAIGVRLESLAEFVRNSHERCDEIEQAAKAVAGLKQDFIDLRARLGPHAAAKDGIKRRFKDLDEARVRLAADIDAVAQTPQGSLGARVQAFADDNNKLEQKLAAVELQSSRLATLRKDVEALAVRFDHALDALSTSEAKSADARIAELSQFVKATQARFDQIERHLAEFGQLRGKLDELQSRLVPLQAKDGVADLIAQVGDIRDRLVAKIERIEADDSGDLAARVNTFIEAKQELEKRVSTVTEQFSKLATIRNDIAGLFDKLSSAADASSN